MPPSDSSKASRRTRIRVETSGDFPTVFPPRALKKYFRSGRVARTARSKKREEKREKRIIHVAKLVTRARKPGVYVVGVKCEVSIAASWLQNRSDCGGRRVSKNGNTAEEVAGNTIVKWYWTNEAIKSLASEASERANSPAAKVAGNRWCCPRIMM